jgi:hypothetical protein
MISISGPVKNYPGDTLLFAQFRDRGSQKRCAFNIAAVFFDLIFNGWRIG